MHNRQDTPPSISSTDTDYSSFAAVSPKKEPVYDSSEGESTTPTEFDFSQNSDSNPNSGTLTPTPTEDKNEKNLSRAYNACYEYFAACKSFYQRADKSLLNSFVREIEEKGDAKKKNPIIWQHFAAQYKSIKDPMAVTLPAFSMKTEEEKRQYQSILENKAFLQSGSTIFPAQADLDPEAQRIVLENMFDILLKTIQTEQFNKNLGAHIQCIGLHKEISVLIDHLTLKQNEAWEKLHTDQQILAIPTLSSTIIEPIQYIPRYEMLLNSALKALHNVSNIDKEKKKALLKKINEIRLINKKSNHSLMHLMPIYVTLQQKASELLGATQLDAEKAAKLKALLNYIKQIETAITQFSDLTPETLLKTLLNDKQIAVTTGKIKHSSSTADDLKKIQKQLNKMREEQAGQVPQKLKDANEKLEEENESLNKEIEKQTAAIEKLQDQMKQLQVLHQAIQDEKNNLVETLKEKENHDTESKKQINEHEQSSTELKKAMDLMKEEHEKKIAKLQDELQKIQEKFIAENNAHALAHQLNQVGNPLEQVNPVPPAENAALLPDGNNIQQAQADADNLVDNQFIQVNPPAIDNLAAENDNNAELQRLRAENQALKATLNNLKASLQSHWLKWLGIITLGAIGIGLIATGVGAIAGLGLLAGVSYTAALALTAGGALALTTAAGTGIHHEVTKNRAIANEMGSIESQLDNEEPFVVVDPSADANEVPAIQHIDDLLPNTNPQQDNVADLEAGADHQPPLVNNLVTNNTLVTAPTKRAWFSFLNNIGGRSNQVAPIHTANTLPNNVDHTNSP